MAKEDFHVLIIGGGSTGLLIAQGLRNASIPHTVFERQETGTYAHRRRDWTMALHWGSSFISELLSPELAADLKYVQPDIHTQTTEKQETTLPFINGKTGEEIAGISTVTTRRASQAKLRALLSRNINVKYGKRLIDIVDEDGQVRAKFQDGTEATGDILVGCDAGDSVVRHWLLGNEKAKLQVMEMEVYNFTQSYTSEKAHFIRDLYHPFCKIMIHPDKPFFFLLATSSLEDPSDPSNWRFQLLMSNWGTKPPSSSSERLARIKELTADICEPFRTAAQLAAEDTYVSQDSITEWTNITPWPNHNGRITLAGDAAHNMTPYRGQGLNNALQDAAMYVKTLRRVFDAVGHVDKSSAEFRDKLKSEIDVYDNEVFERGKREIMISSYQAKVTHTWTDFMDSPIVKQGLHAK